MGEEQIVQYFASRTTEPFLPAEQKMYIPDVYQRMTFSAKLGSPKAKYCYLLALL